MTAPLIVTLRFDAESQARFQQARDRWFPPERNIVPAHLTLFHHLPGDRDWDVCARLAEVAGRTPAIPFRVTGILAMGRGAGYRLELNGIDDLRARIGAGFDLTDQDRARIRPHVTVQNKVSKPEARDAVEALRAGFAPWQGWGLGLDLWRYRGGPWDAVDHFAFAGASDPIEGDGQSTG